MKSEPKESKRIKRKYTEEELEKFEEQHLFNLITECKTKAKTLNLKVSRTNKIIFYALRCYNRSLNRRLKSNLRKTLFSSKIINSCVIPENKKSIQNSSSSSLQGVKV